MFEPFRKVMLKLSFLLQVKLFAYTVDDFQNEANNSFRIKLEETFGHDFYNIIEISDVLVWRISLGQKTFKPQDYSEGFTEFGANETYLIFTQNWRFHFTLYYWVGAETTLGDKKYVAKHAATFFLFVNKYNSHGNVTMNFAREDQIFESESFVHTLNQLRVTPQPEDGRIVVFRDDHFPLNGPNLYLVVERWNRSIMKMPLNVGIQLMMLETCLVVEVPPYIEHLYTVSIYCADGASEAIRWVARSLTIDIRRTTNKYIRPVIISRESDKYKAMLELFENREYYRASEIAYLDDKNKIFNNQDEGIYLFEITMANIDGQQKIIREAVFELPFEIGDIDEHTNFILDTKSVAGIFFVYGEETNMNDIIWAIQNAEEYLHDQIWSLSRPIRMRITSADSNKFPIDFEINMVN